MQSAQFQTQTQYQVQVNGFIRSVYNWMCIGLGLTALVAFFVANNPTLQAIVFGNPLVLYGLLFGELGLVFYLSARVQKINAGTATNLFLIYAALNGATLSVILLRFTGASIAAAFFICAATFAACSVYGMVTKKDLTSLGGFMMMGLIGILIASVVNIFLASPAIYWIINYIGVIVFIGLTAYDTQKLKHMAMSQPADLDAAVIRKGAIIGALTLYLDFINMFIFLVHILGGSRD